MNNTCKNSGITNQLQARSKDTHHLSPLLFITPTPVKIYWKIKVNQVLLSSRLKTRYNKVSTFNIYYLSLLNFKYGN